MLIKQYYIKTTVLQVRMMAMSVWRRKKKILLILIPVMSSRMKVRLVVIEVATKS